MDLKDTDIEVWVNDQRLETFTLYKREFIVSQPGHQEAVDSQQPPEISKKKPPRVLKSQSIFLLFDVAMSGPRCTKHSKNIARKIITEAEPGIQFAVLDRAPASDRRPPHHQEALVRPEKVPDHAAEEMISLDKEEHDETVHQL